MVAQARGARAPLRISLAGGGTDLPAYADQFDGMVVSLAIQQYATARIADAMHPYSVLVGSCIDEATCRSWCEDNVLPNLLQVECDVEPGTGLGSSSAMCCAVLRRITPEAAPREIADAACAVEIERLGAPIGRQDQYASAFGGMNVFRFHADGVEVEPLMLPTETITALEQQLLLFRDGVSRNSDALLRAQQQAMRLGGDVRHAMHAIKAIAQHMLSSLRLGDIEAVGHLLHRSWTQKRQLPGVDTPQIGRAYTQARRLGALGGKLCGAGGGGHLLLLAPVERHGVIEESLGHLGLTRVPLAIDWTGARIE